MLRSNNARKRQLMLTSHQKEATIGGNEAWWRWHFFLAMWGYLALLKHRVAIEATPSRGEVKVRNTFSWWAWHDSSFGISWGISLARRWQFDSFLGLSLVVAVDESYEMVVLLYIIAITCLEGHCNQVFALLLCKSLFSFFFLLTTWIFLFQMVHLLVVKRSA